MNGLTRTRYMPQRGLVNRMSWGLVFLMLWFTTIPSLDKPIITPDGKVLHPSRGTPGSTTCINGQWYIRTGRGFRKCGPWLGKVRQKHAVRQRRKAIAVRAAAGTGLVGTIAGLVFTLSQAVR